MTFRHILGTEYRKFHRMWLLINGRGCCVYDRCVSFIVSVFLCEDDYSMKV